MTTTKKLNNSKFNFSDYSNIIVFFSGGKDSTALVLYLLDEGVDKSKIELWHHDIDGREGSTLMDWPITRDYCRKFAQAFGLPIYFSWKEGGFEREMLRNNSRTAPIVFEDGSYQLIKVGGERGQGSTRMKFPQVSPDLSVRWCSAYLKIDVGSAAIRNQDRFLNKKTLVLSGERGEESAARAKYQVFEPDRSDNRNGKRVTRHVDRFRPIKDWKEQEVWDLIKKYKVRVHPAYYMGWGRVSCLFCIFGNANQWKSAEAISPSGCKKIIDYEEQFGATIKRKDSVKDLLQKGETYSGMTPELINLAKSDKYSLPVIMDEEWVLPSGAFGDSCGPL